MSKYIFFILIISSSFVAAQSNIDWWKLSDTAAMPSIDGQGWPKEIGNTTVRLPKRAEAVVAKPVWNLAQQSAGLSIRFISNAPEITVRYQVKKAIDLANMPATGVSGVDLYALNSEGLWCWASAKYSFKDTVEYKYTKLLPNDANHKFGREYRLYLPLYNEVSNLEIGFPTGTLFKILQPRSEKPIVVYGTSIAQGACATRPGMAWTNILSRKLDRTVVNLGFSGNGLLEKGMIGLINEIDAKAYILDCLPNLTGLRFDSSDVYNRIINSVKTIREKHPNTPIILTEHAGYTDSYLVTDRQVLYEGVNRTLQKAFAQLIADKIEGISLLTKNEIGIDIDGMFDGTHPNDYGMMLYANAYEKKLRELLLEPVGKLKTQIPIRQRRTANYYDWENRHNVMLELSKTESNKVMFFGNSITHNWGGKPLTKQIKGAESWQKYLGAYEVRNLGFGADRIENVLWRVYHDELDGTKPKKILIDIGTNNFRPNSNEEIIEGIRFLIQAIKLHQPLAKIIVVGIYPRREQEERVVTINKGLRLMAKEEKVAFADIGKVLLQDDKKINESLFTDGLHPNPKGYEELGVLLEKVIKK